MLVNLSAIDEDMLWVAMDGVVQDIVEIRDKIPEGGIDADLARMEVLRLIGSKLGIELNLES